MLNLWHVQAFVAIVDTGNFHEAARQLGLAQPTVSQHLRLLEESLGAQLVIRQRGHCVPSAVGRDFLQISRTLLRAAARAKACVSRRGAAVGAASNVGIYLLQPYLQRMRALEPSLGDIDLRIGPNPDVADMLESGEIDIAVMEWWDGRKGFAARSWKRERLVVIVPPDHAWADRPSISVSELAGEVLLGGEPGTGTGTLLQRAFGADAKALRVGATLGSTEAVKRAVRAGSGVSIVTGSSVADEVERGSLHALNVVDHDLYKDIMIVHRDDMQPMTTPGRVADLLETIGLD